MTFDIDTVRNLFNLYHSNSADNILMITEQAHDNTCNKTCVTSKDSDQSVHLPSTARVLVYHSLDRLLAVEGTRNQRKL